MLEMRGVETFYGPSQVLFGVDLDVATGDVVTLLGRNGMGKTTVVRSIMGLARVRAGKISFDDVKIRPETLEYQAQIAEDIGRPRIAGNLRRAAEMTRIPDQRVLEIYNSLRPYRCTKQELLDIAQELDSKYGARVCAKFVREAADVYEKRGRLKQ